jgi:hypothetical protein
MPSSKSKVRCWDFCFHISSGQSSNTKKKRAMFFLIEREDTLALHPKYFGKKIELQILAQLKAKVRFPLSVAPAYPLSHTYDTHEGDMRQIT